MRVDGGRKSRVDKISTEKARQDREASGTVRLQGEEVEKKKHEFMYLWSTVQSKKSVVKK